MNKKVLLFASAIMLNIGVVLASDVGEGILDDIRALLSPTEVLRVLKRGYNH